MDDQRGRASRTQWLPARQELDPLAVLLRACFRSRADLALRAEPPDPAHLHRRCLAPSSPHPHVLAKLGNPVDPDELAAVTAALHARHAPGLSVRQRAVLDALAGFPDQHLLDLAPHLHELARDHSSATDAPTARTDGARGDGAGLVVGRPRAHLRCSRAVGGPVNDLDDALLVAPSARAQAPTLLALGLAFALYAVLGATGVLAPVIAVLGVLVFGAVLSVGGLQAVRARRWPSELRLDAAGLTVRGHPTVPWMDLAEVRVTGLRPRWVFWFSLGYRVVSFVPQPGVELPALPSTSRRGRAEPQAARVRRRWYGSALIVLPSAMNASADDITRAVRRWSAVPVR